MSDEMAVSDNATGETTPMQSDEATVSSVEEAAEGPSEQLNEIPIEEAEQPQAQPEDIPKVDIPILDIVKKEPEYIQTDEKPLEHDIKNEPEEPQLETTVVKEEIEDAVVQEYVEYDNRGIKRRASDAFSDDGDVEFLGFPEIKHDDVASEYSGVLERLEAEVIAASKTFTPVRSVMATPLTPIRASKRARKDTDGSRPSSAQSSRSEDDPSDQRMLPPLPLPNPISTPGQRGRRATTEISSPLLRIPLERGWKRELVYRAALDMHSRRNADIYYYTPAGKKLRSTREISENLSGTGLTLEYFSFFKEPLGVADPNKEVIRDAKVMRRVESPVVSPAPSVDSKRSHKPKVPKGVSPEPATTKSPPLKLKVKSLGSRLSSSTPAVMIKQEKQKRGSSSPAPAAASATAPAPAAASDNNNTAAWKKPRAPDQDPGAPGTSGTLGAWPAESLAAVRTRSRSTRDGTPTVASTSVTPTSTPSASREVTPVATVPRPITPITLVRDVSPLSAARRDSTPPSVTRWVVTSPSITRRVVTPPPVTRRVVTSPPVTRRVVTPPPVTRRVVTPPPVTRRVVTPPSVTRRVVTPPPVTRRVVTPPPVTRRVVTPPPRIVTPPPQPKPQQALELSSPDIQSPRRVLQPCSMTCGMGVPSLSCAVCLCMYHPKCAGYTHNAPRDRFLCKNCRKSTSPPMETVGVGHKPAAMGGTPAAATPAPRRLLQQHKASAERRVTLKMKVSGGSDGSRVWAVAGRGGGGGPAVRPAPPASRPRPAALPQALAVINGKRFIVVPRPAPLPQPAQPLPTAHELKTRSRVSNGAAPSPAPAPAVASPRRRGRPRMDETDHFSTFYNRAQQGKNDVVIQIFQYLGMRDLAHCARVSKLWKQLAATPSLWRHVRMKNSQVSDWGGLCAALKRHGTKWLDLRKMLLPQNDAVFWEQFAQHIGTVDTLERLEMCRCPASAVQAAAGALRGLVALSALAIRDAALDPAPLARAPLLRELRLKSMAGLALTADLTHLANLTHLTHLSLTSIKELGWRACDVIGELTNLESLELGECTFRAEFAQVLARLQRLKRLRLERGTAHCAAPAILRALAHLPNLTRLELVNIDVKIGFDDALAECKNIQRLLIIPTYVSQSATTNKQVLSGVLRLKDTLTHLMWGVTIELLRVTELFIDQCSAGGGARRELGECIPVLKPVPGCRLPMDHQLVAGPPQVEILPLPTLQRLLSAQLPNTKLKLLRIPFHATWRQSLADFQ